jgi:hypothetical protein
VNDAHNSKACRQNCIRVHSEVKGFKSMLLTNIGNHSLAKPSPQIINMNPQEATAAIEQLQRRMERMMHDFAAAQVTIADQRNQIIALQAAEQQDRNEIVAIRAAPAGGAAAAGGRRVLPRITFANGEKEDWLSFKESFLNFARFQRYNLEDSKWALKSCMQGNALLAVTGFNHEDAAEDLNALIVRYEAKFLPPQASALARSQYENAKQGAKESLLSYHGRMATLFTRAYPTVAINAQTIRNFTTGLKSVKMREFVFRSNPDTWDGVLAAAQSEQATMDSIKTTTSEDSMEINALDSRTIRCHYCGKLGHVAAECNLKKKDIKDGKIRPTDQRNPRRSAANLKKVFPDKKKRVQKLLQEILVEEDDAKDEDEGFQEEPQEDLDEESTDESESTEELSEDF